MGIFFIIITFYYSVTVFCIFYVCLSLFRIFFAHRRVALFWFTPLVCLLMIPGGYYGFSAPQMLDVIHFNPDNYSKLLPAFIIISSLLWIVLPYAVIPLVLVDEYRWGKTMWRHTDEERKQILMSRRKSRFKPN